MPTMKHAGAPGIFTNYARAGSMLDAVEYPHRRRVAPDFPNSKVTRTGPAS